MTISENTRRIAELLQQRPPLKHADIAKLVGVDRRRVYQVRKYLDANGSYQEFDAGAMNWLRSLHGWSLRELGRHLVIPNL